MEAALAFDVCPIRTESGLALSAVSLCTGNQGPCNKGLLSSSAEKVSGLLEQSKPKCGSSNRSNGNRQQASDHIQLVDIQLSNHILRSGYRSQDDCVNWYSYPRSYDKLPQPSRARYNFLTGLQLALDDINLASKSSQQS